MTDLKQISIVVPSYNQGHYLAETLQSLVDQDYPALQVIIQDGGSTDNSVAVAKEFVARYPSIFSLFIEKDAGQADALNRGFARATGEILGFLNSDDTLYPRILHRVSMEINPRAGRHVVMGRSLFIGENSRYVGVEHPAEYKTHFEHLAIWRRGYNTIPQPSVFWHKSVTERVGWLDVNEHHALDYDLFCRFSRYYPFHRIDELFSNYRMHDESKSSQRTEAEVLALSIGVSRKHWGSRLSPLYWRLAASHWAYSKHFHERARHHARRAEEAFKHRKLGRAVVEFAQTARYSPKMARNRLLYGWLARRRLNVLSRLVAKDTSFHGEYADGWIGPSYVAQVEVPAGAKHIEYHLEYVPQPSHDPFDVVLLIDGAMAERHSIGAPGGFVLRANVSEAGGRTLRVEIRSDSSFCPREVLGVDDDRELSLKNHGFTFG